MVPYYNGRFYSSFRRFKVAILIKIYYQNRIILTVSYTKTYLHFLDKYRLIYRGKTSFWNGRTGTLTDAYQTHIADVLTIATNDSQSIVYSSGVDPTIMQFQPISSNLHGSNGKPISSTNNINKIEHRDGIANGIVHKRPKWVKTSHRSANTHDVRAILCVGKKVIFHRIYSMIQLLIVAYTKKTEMILCIILGIVGRGRCRFVHQ